MRAGVLASVLACCALVAPAIAEAKVRPSPTEIVLTGADLESIDARLENPFKGCLRGRTVTLTDRGSGQVLRTTTTTREGVFSIALADVPSGTSAVRVGVSAKRHGNRLCTRDSVDVAFDQATLTGGPFGSVFRGVLSSSIDACEPNRVVSLYEITFPEEPVFVGFDVTDTSGVWEIASAGGSWQALADLAFIGGGNSFSYCRPVASPTWSFEEPPE